LRELPNATEILFFIYKYMNLLPKGIFQDSSLFNTVPDRSEFRVQVLRHMNQSIYLAVGGCICHSALLLSGKHWHASDATCTGLALMLSTRRWFGRISYAMTSLRRMLANFGFLHNFSSECCSPLLSIREKGVGNCLWQTALFQRKWKIGKKCPLTWISYSKVLI